MSKIKINEFVSDIKSGVTYPDLMKKYQIPTQEKLKAILTQLIKAGHINQSDLNRKKTLFKCPACAQTQPHEFEECPSCGIILSKYLKKKENQSNQKPELREQVSPTPENTKNKIFSIIGLALSWFFGVVLLMMGLIYLFKYPIVGLCYTGMSLLLLPPLENLCIQKQI